MRVETYTVNGYNQLTAVAGTAREYTNVCGLLDESNVDTVTVKNVTFDPDEEAARVDVMHDYFIGRKLKVADGDNGSTSCCLDEASLRRVSRSCGGDIEVTVTDLAGNSTTAGSGGTYDFDQEEDINVKYEYDVRGNMVLKQVWDGEAYVDKERYFYNYDNLIEYIWYASGDNDNKHPYFIYDGLNRRVRIEYGTVTLDGNDDFDYFTEDTEGTAKEYVFNGVVPIVEYDYDSGEETREVARQYYWGLDIVAGIGGLLYQKVPGGTPAYYYYHYDGSGNVTAITDSTKTVKALYEYDAFGNIITKAGTLANDFTFSTQMAYGASGWSMYMFRNYSPRLGRWTQRDPIGPREGPNLYAFCGNNPSNLIDQLGANSLVVGIPYYMAVGDFAMVATLMVALGLQQVIINGETFTLEDIEDLARGICPASSSKQHDSSNYEQRPLEEISETAQDVANFAGYYIFGQSYSNPPPGLKTLCKIVLVTLALLFGTEVVLGMFDELGDPFRHPIKNPASGGGSSGHYYFSGGGDPYGRPPCP